MNKIFNVSTDPIRIRIPKKYLYGNENILDYERGYLVSVKAVNNSTLGFTVHLESGALFSNLPIEAIYYDDGKENSYIKEKDLHLSTDVLQPYSCIDGDVQYIQYEYLRGYKGLGRVGAEVKPIAYQFTLDYRDTSFSSDPEQYKTHNIVYIEDNLQFAALPNNYCLRSKIKYESGT